MKIYKGGVLIIGSLIWEDSKIRKSWRDQNLKMDEKRLISLPIRYGRISGGRKNTYTMIYSSECKLEEKKGKGYFIPFQKEGTIEHIIKQCEILIDAEHNEKKELNRFNWGWGCIGIAINPNLTDEKCKDLYEKWKENYSNGFNPDQYKVGEEEPIVTKDGILKIDWNEDLKDVEFVIGTATKPELENYPDPQKIAEVMKVEKYDEYFKNNIKISITTFQDVMIKEELNR